MGVETVHPAWGPFGRQVWLMERLLEQRAAPAVGMEGQRAALVPEPGQTAQAGPADTVRAKRCTATLL